MKIANIIPQVDFTLLIELDNGKSGFFDIRPYLELEAFRPLQNSDEFIKVKNGGYFVEWNCGADLSADTIFAKLEELESNAKSTIQSIDLAK